MEQFFAHLTTLEGILEHLQAYIDKPLGVSDPEHYRELKSAVVDVVEALTLYLGEHAEGNPS